MAAESSDAAGAGVSAVSGVRYPIRSDKFVFDIAVKETLFDRSSEFQQITIIDTVCFGKALLLDGHIQFTDLDEAAYHESLVQIPLMQLHSPKKALVLGGGDGGVIRELCRSSLEHIDMVEIDEMVIEACREHLLNISGGAFDNPRVHLTIGDAFAFVKESGHGPYDLIVLDATDTYEDASGELSEALFTKAFYEDCAKLLSPNGIVVTQADNLLFCPYSLESIEKAFREVFPNVGSYWSIVPSYGGFSGFCWASYQNDFKGEFVPYATLRYLTETTYKLGMGPLPFDTSCAYEG